MTAKGRKQHPGAGLLALVLALVLLAAVDPAFLKADTGMAATVAATDAYGAPDETAADVAGEESGALAAQYGQTDNNFFKAPATSASTAIVPLATADTIAPVITGLIPADGAVTGPTVFLGASYSDPEPSSGIRNSTAMIHIDNRHQYGCTITQSGISLLKSGLSEGAHKIEAFICDNNFNCSVSTWHITVDATGPAISANQPTGTINSTDAVISASFSDGDGAGVQAASAEVLLDGGNITPDCQVTAAGINCPAAGLAEGIHTVQVSVLDLVGNGSTGTWTFSVDTGAIGVTNQNPAPGSWLRHAAPLIGASFQPAGMGIIDTSSITLLVDGMDVTAGADLHSAGITYAPFPQNLSEGWHTVSLTVRDDASHTGQSEWSFAIDTIPPSIENEAPSGPAAGQPTVSALYSDDGSGIDEAGTSLTIDGLNATESATITADGITYAPHEGFPPGPHSVQLSVRDRAGNQQVSAWTFSIPEPQDISRPAPRQEGAPAASVVDYWLSYSPLPGPGVGSWIISGFHTFPATYYLPWYDAGPASSAESREIVITNRGAGEAFVNVLVGGVNKWEEKIAEGDMAICRMPGTAGGPVKIICPTGQPLEVLNRTLYPGGVDETPAVAQDELESVLLLPWFESRAAGEGSSSLAIANAGSEEATVEVYVGDPALPESLKSRLSIGPESAAIAQLHETRGGPVRIVSTNDQPLAASYQEAANGSFHESLATGFSRLRGSYRVESDPEPQGQIRKLLLGNANDEDRRVRISLNGNPLDDPEGPEGDFLILRHAGRVIEIRNDADETIDIECLDCGLGEGLALDIVLKKDQRR